jgi:phosphatidate cytidylyltransferase
MAMGNLAARLLVAIVAVPLLLVIIYRDEPFLVWGLVFAASLLTMSEYFAMTLVERRDRIASLGLGALSALALYWVPARAGGQLLALTIAVLPVSLYYLFRFGELGSVADRLAHSITGIVYAGLLFAFIALLKRDLGPLGGDLVVLVLVIAWLSDTGGYFAGKAVGKRKLYEAVSPKKTWAGAVGGVLCALGGAAVIKVSRLDAQELLPVGWTDVLLLAVPGSILGQLGDLVESLIKRSRGVKDSGSVLPGHGGMLDRLDAVLFIAPYVYLYTQLRWLP